MSDQDINYKFTADGVDQTVQGTEQVNDSLKKTGDQTEQTGKAAQETAGGFDKFKTSITGWITRAGSFLVILANLRTAWRLFTGSIRDNTEAMKENAEVTEQQQRRLLRLQYLGDFFKQNPNIRQDVGAVSEMARRPFDEVADAWYNLRSKNAGLSNADQMSILTEAAELVRTDPSVPMDAIVDTISLYRKQSGVTDSNRIQNVIQQTITEAGGSSTDVAAYMPRFLPIGISGGLSPSEAAGLWAYGTTQESEASVATTGLRAVLMGLQGKGSPEGKKLLQQMGITQDMDFFTKIAMLGNQNIDLATAETLFQREGATMGLNLLKDPAAMMRTIDAVTAADRGDIDLTAAKIEGLMSTDPLARLAEESRQTEIETQNIRGRSERSLRWEIYKKKIERNARAMEAPEWQIKAILKAQDILSGLGMEPGEFMDTGTDFRDPATGKYEDLSGNPAAAGRATTIINYNNNKTIMTKTPPASTRPGEL